jgi:histidinol-phosphate aminotransferase
MTATRAAGFDAADLADDRVEGLLRPEVRALELYTASHAPALVDLSDNTSQRGAPPAAMRALAQAGADSLARYPTLYADVLRDAAARYHGVSPDEVVTGCGSDDVLASAIRAFAGPGDVLTHPAPTFGMIPYFARLAGISPIAVPLFGPEGHYDIDVDGLLAPRPKVVYVCSPNNPTGTLASRGAIDALLARAEGLVILDEAYVEFGGESRVREARAHGRLVVVRTMSKAFGLAGARAGVGITSAAIARAMTKVRGPFKVATLGERVAAAALDHDRAWMEEGVREVHEARARFVAWLDARAAAQAGRARPLPSEANFVLLPVPGARAVAQALLDRGIVVRAFAALPGIGDALRISIGPWPLMERILPALDEVLP